MSRNIKKRRKLSETTENAENDPKLRENAENEQKQQKTWTKSRNDTIVL